MALATIHVIEPNSRSEVHDQAESLDPLTDRAVQ
jgi:hypothetical protein